MQTQTFGAMGLRALVACVALAFAGTAAAQQQGGGGDNPRMQLQQIQQRLAEVQQQALDENPGLQAQREELEELVMETMEAEGYDPDANMETLESVQGQIQDESLSDEERQQMLQEAQQAQQQLQEAQQVAMQNEDVVEAQQTFQEDLMSAMRELDSETDQLIEEFQRIRQEMQQNMQRQGGMGGQQGGGNAPQ